jgi:hypothetical protein
LQQHSDPTTISIISISIIIIILLLLPPPLLHRKSEAAFVTAPRILSLPHNILETLSSPSLYPIICHSLLTLRSG